MKHNVCNDLYMHFVLSVCAICTVYYKSKNVRADAAEAENLVIYLRIKK